MSAENVTEAALVQEARRRARLLGELASLVERYRLLLAHAADAPGRTVARRAAMRELSTRFPGSLRELDCVGEAVIRERAAVTAHWLRQLLRVEVGKEPQGEPSAASGEWPAMAPLWMRALIELQPRLREVLRIKRWLAERGARTSDVQAALSAWYTGQAGGGDPVLRSVPDADLVAQVIAPSGGQVQQVAYERAARALSVSVVELKRAIYGDVEAAEEAL